MLFVGCSREGGETSSRRQDERMQELPVSRGPQLKLKLDGTERNPILVIRLMNGGSSPIVVDAEMVFLVGVEIRAVDGTKVDFETFGVVDRTGASAEEWRKRFKELAPGELAERRMALQVIRVRHRQYAFTRWHVGIQRDNGI